MLFRSTGRALQELILKYRDAGEQEVLSEAFIREVFVQVMHGLREVHANKMLHLDLKPANIYLRRDGTPILLDFGAARTTMATDASKLFPMYTPGFAPLEMYRKEAIGPWTDVYSLGACMFACMAGMPPQASDARAKNDKMEAAYKALRGIYSDEMIGIVRWCLKMDGKARPQSVFQLQKILSHESHILAKPPWHARAMASIRHFFRRGQRAGALRALRHQAPNKKGIASNSGTRVVTKSINGTTTSANMSEIAANAVKK